MLRPSAGVIGFALVNDGTQRRSLGLQKRALPKLPPRPGSLRDLESGIDARALLHVDP